MSGEPIDREATQVTAILAGVEGVTRLAEAIDHADRLLNELDAELERPELADGNLKHVAWCLGRAVLEVRLAAFPEPI